MQRTLTNDDVDNFLVTLCGGMSYSHITPCMSTYTNTLYVCGLHISVLLKCVGMKNYLDLMLQGKQRDCVAGLTPPSPLPLLMMKLYKVMEKVQVYVAVYFG